MDEVHSQRTKEEWRQPGMTARDCALGFDPAESGLAKLAAAAVGGALELWDAAHSRGMMPARHQPRPPLGRQIVCELRLATFLEGPVTGLGPLEFGPP